MAYIPFGPFTDSSAPGVSAEFLNPLETFLVSVNSAATDSHITADGNGKLTLPGPINLNPTVTTINGGLAGSADCYQFFQGTLKLVIINMKTFRTGASNQDFTLPTPFTSKGYWWTGDIDTSTFMSGGAAQNVDVITALAAGGGTSVNQATFGSYSFGACSHPIDTIRFVSGAGSNHSGFIILIGI